MVMISNKYKLLAVSTEESINIGDYIQALASLQFLPSYSGFIERERLKEYDDEECNVIMNGWYMHNAVHWPPSFRINPFYISVHINIGVERLMLNSDSIKYFQNYGPIGCRDERTCDLLRKNGIEAYFSGCMTLTLGYKYKTTECDGQYYFVDAYAEMPSGIKFVIEALSHLFTHPFSVATIVRKYPKQARHLYGKILKSSYFHKEYSKLFSNDILMNAHYICQQSSQYKKLYKTNEELLSCAENLIKKYARAKLVITSRIHCGLPCLGIETPVLYVHNLEGNQLDDCRLNGILDLFNIIEWRNGHLIRPDFIKEKKITCSTVIKNQEGWRHLANDLAKRCFGWVKKYES